MLSLFLYFIFFHASYILFFSRQIVVLLKINLEEKSREIIQGNKRKSFGNNKNNKKFTVRHFLPEKDRMSVDEIKLENLDSRISLGHSIHDFVNMSEVSRQRLFMECILNPNDVEHIMNIECPNMRYLVALLLYWYSNTSLPQSTNYLLSFLITVVFYSFIDKEVLPKAQAKHDGRSFCLHCYISSQASVKDDPVLIKLVEKHFQCQRQFVGSKSCKNVNVGDVLPEKASLVDDIKSLPGYSRSSSSSFVSKRSVVSKENIANCYASLSRFELVSLTESCPNYNRDFVHASGEFQACLYYFEMLNSLMLSPFKPICIENFFSGTFSYCLHSAILENSEDVFEVQYNFLKYVSKF